MNERVRCCHILHKRHESLPRSCRFCRESATRMAANPLESPISVHTKSKSGKNGNVDHPSQLCHLILSSVSSVSSVSSLASVSSVVVLVSLPHSARSPFLDPPSGQV